MAHQTSSNHTIREIIIQSNTIPIEELKKHLESAGLMDVQFDTREAASKKRIGFTEPVLIAIITAAGPTIGALVSALLKYLSSGSKKKIVVETKNGSIEVPANLSEDRLQRLVDRLNTEEHPRILLL